MKVKPTLLFFLCALALACGVASNPAPVPGGGLAVDAVAIELNAGEPEQTRYGELTFIAGFELRSGDPRFGGFSGLLVSPAGDALYAVSDRGYWLSARLRHDRSGRLAGFDHWEMDDLLTPEGRAVTGLLRDSEGLARDRDGSVIVSFEQVHRLWRYPPPPAGFRSAARPIPTPPELDEAPRNGGIEGVTVLADGRILIITEQLQNADGTMKGWLIDRQRFAALSYVVSDGFHVTDLAVLPDGDVLALERRHGLADGWATRIRRIARADLRPEAALDGREVARLEPPLAVDNFEGMAAREDPALGTFLYIISDDNYRPFQRTLLLQFRIERMGSNRSSRSSSSSPHLFFEETQDSFPPPRRGGG